MFSISKVSRGIGMLEWTKLEPREKITSRTLQNDNIILLYKDSPHQVSSVAQQKVCRNVLKCSQMSADILVQISMSGDRQSDISADS